MTATEMHDLLRDSLKEIAKNVWKQGDQFPGRLYCRYCGNWQGLSTHLDSCVLARLIKATNSEGSYPQPGEKP